MDYNDAFLNLMAAVEQKNINGIRQHTQKSLECARSLKQPDLEIGVLFMAATGFLEVKQLPTALKVYDEATKIAKDAELKETNKDLYQRLGAQIMLCKSSALFTQTPPQYNMAIEAYQQTADKCQEIITNKMEEM